MKKTISIVLAAIMMFTVSAVAFKNNNSTSYAAIDSYAGETLENESQTLDEPSTEETTEPETQEPTTEEPTTEPEEEIGFLKGFITAMKAVFQYIVEAWTNLEGHGGVAALMDAVFDSLKATGLDIEGFYEWFVSSGILEWFASIFLK